MMNENVGPLLCEVKHVIYNNPSNGYTVIVCKLANLNKMSEQECRTVPLKLLDRFTACGTMVDIRDGDIVKISGYWEMTKYGEQIHIIQYFKEQVQLTSLDALEKYLSSGLVKGVGQKLVHSIITKFGDKTIETIENDPTKLAKIKGISKKKAQDLHDAWVNNTKVNTVLTGLQQIGLSSAYALKVYNYFKEKDEKPSNIVDTIKDNPYCLTDVQGIGFKTADGIARRLGITNNDERRIQAGIEYTLLMISNSGDVYCTKKDLIEQTNIILQVHKSLIAPQIDKLEEGDNSRLVQDNDKIYLRYFYSAEKGIAVNINRLLSCRVEINKPNIDKIEEIVGISYDDTQKKAIKTALSEKMMILTGGPGTGKTTTIKGIIEACKEADLSVDLAAPTGRASKRMSEVTGLYASTIHKLLDYKCTETGWTFLRNEENPLDEDVLIIDEMSMVDILLMNYLLKAIPDRMRVIFVGDIDQLPSVGPGNVLRDMIDSGIIPTIQLVNIFRQAQTSKIITNAHLVNKGLMPDISNSEGTDFFFIKRDMDTDPVKVADELAKIFKEAPKQFGVTQEDVQILSPMKKGPLGTIWLNNTIQSILPNFNQPCITRGDYHFRKGDRVMQIRNDYDYGIFNGDLGIVHSIDFKNHGLTVDFSGVDVDYSNATLDEIITAYACTIHKSQGSEYPVVIIPITLGHRIMLQRNLIYTAITRAKKVCVLVGSEEALEYAVSNNIVIKRNTWLKQRIQKVARISMLSLYK